MEAGSAMIPNHEFDEFLETWENREREENTGGDAP